MKKIGSSMVLVAIFTCAMLSMCLKAEAGVIATGEYEYCSTEANDAMTLGRIMMVVGKTPQSFLDNSALPERIHALVKRYVAESESGKLKTYAHFAADVFIECAKSKEIPIELNEKKAFLCLTRVDIPYFFMLERDGGKTIGLATMKVEGQLAGWNYPSGLVKSLAAPSYKAAGVEAMNELQLFVFNSCYLPDEEVTAFYG